MSSSRSKARLHASIGAALAALFVSAAPVAAQEATPTTENLLQRAIAVFADGSFDEARSLLHRARDLTRQSRLLGQIHLHLGLISAAENRKARARREFRAALSHDPTIDLDERQYSRSFVTLFRSARHRMLGTLRVSVDRSDVQVWVGERRYGPPPVQIHLLPGEHTVTVRGARGQILNSSPVKITAGHTSQLAVAAAVRQPAGRPPEQVPPARPAHARRRRLWTWVAGAAAVASAALAIGFGVAANAERDAACALMAGSAPCDARQRLIDDNTRPQYEERYEAMERKATAANVAWGAAAVLGMSSVLLYFVEGRSDRAPSSAHLRLLHDSHSTAQLQLELRY